MRLATSIRKFKSLTRNLTHHPAVMASETLEQGSAEQAGEIAWSVGTAARFTPWESACLVQGLAAQRMLQGSGIPGQLVLGVRKLPAEDTSKALDAHAWVICGGKILIGKRGHEDFTVVSSFSW
jgi:hypothetical protein